jgi:CAAX protease family protein
MDPHQDPPSADQPPTPPPAEPTPARPQQDNEGWQAPVGWSPQQPPPYGAPPPYPGTPPQYPQYVAPPPGYPQYGQQPYHPFPRQPRVVPAAAGTPFHRLARTPLHKWWRPIVGTVVLGLAALFATLFVMVVWSAISPNDVAGDYAGNALFDNPTEDIAVNLVLLGILTPLVLLTVWLIQRRPAFSVASVLQKIRWRWLALCCLPGLAYLVANIALGNAFEALFPNVDTGPETDDGSWVGWARFVVPALVILVLVPFQSAAEEFVFRGWLVQAIGAYGPDNTDGKPVVQLLKRLFRSPWPALVVSSVAFVFGHGYTGWAMADIFLFAMTVGWLTIRTGGLETGIALHSVNNLIAFMIPAALGQLDGWADQGGAPWPVFVLDLPCIALYAVSVLWLAKRYNIARVS